MGLALRLDGMEKQPALKSRQEIRKDYFSGAINTALSTFFLVHYQQ